MNCTVNSRDFFFLSFNNSVYPGNNKVNQHKCNLTKNNNISLSFNLDFHFLNSVVEANTLCDISDNGLSHPWPLYSLESVQGKLCNPIEQEALHCTFLY